MSVLQTSRAWPLALVIAAGMAVAPAAWAEGSSITSADRMFVGQLAQGNRAEIQLGQLAEQRASSDSVRSFGRRMVRDHGQLESQIDQWTAKNQVAVPSGIGTEPQDELRRLQGLGVAAEVFVGHSLGSVIAYDILKHVWEECHEDYRLPKKSKQTALAEVEKIGAALDDGSTEFTLNDYMDAQIEAWKELRGLGLPWLVTDLVTLGSPLAHAAMLLASGEADLRARTKLRHPPCCRGHSFPL